MAAVLASRLFLFSGAPRSSIVVVFRGLTWVALSVLTAELAGYLLHRLLHSEKIAWLSRSHLEHHLDHYGPLHPMRPSAQYVDATTGRWAIGNVGLEWIVPSALLLAVFLGLFALIGLTWPYQLSFVAITLGWSSFMFSYLHDHMHVTGFWMERNRCLRGWFLAARHLHDIHHFSMDNHGRMDRNFGIGFYFLDRLFHTFRAKQLPVSQAGFADALSRRGATR
jgi:sterol desaturase/sphingolipid hydroxylase (fatty acid hydroxylase superfamily)